VSAAEPPDLPHGPRAGGRSRRRSGATHEDVSAAEPPDLRPVGSVGAARLARVDGHGGLAVDGSGIRLEWWVGADDRWRVAAEEAAVRQRRLGAAPVYETALRVPSGDVLHRVYAIGGIGEPVLLEIENDSPAPVALALVLHGLPPGARLDGTRLELDDDLALDATKPAGRVIVAPDTAALRAAVERGERVEPMPTSLPEGAAVVALLHPIAHRTRARFALVLDPAGAPAVDLVSAPGASDAAQGWDAMLRRGMQVVLVDGARQTEVDQARADLLLEAGLPGAGAEVFVALEDWGFDAEAVDLWRRLGWRARRRAGRRVPPSGEHAKDKGSAAGGPGVPARLRVARDAVVAERSDGVVVLAPDPLLPGESLEVHDAPTRAGSVSYAVRWHGDRAALLWDVQPRATVRLVAPGLDASWATDEPSGEVLLGPAPVSAGEV
jgi:hypothetical protein